MPQVKYLDQVGLKKVVTSMGQVVDQKVANKVTAVVSANTDQISVDVTDPINPKLALGTATVTKIDTLWGLSNDGAGTTLDLIQDADIDQIFDEVFPA